MKKIILTLIVLITFLFVACGGGSNDERGSCKNIFETNPSTSYASIELGESVSNVHHKNVGGYIIKGEYNGKIFSVEFKCNHTHKIIIDNDFVSQGSFVADYDGSSQLIYLYSGDTVYTISLNDYAIDLNKSKFNSTGQITSITKTLDCTQYEATEAVTYGITCNASNQVGYLFCTYEFYLSNANTTGYWQYQSFAAILNDAEKLTESINRQGGHVNLVDGAEELKVFQRGDDRSEGIFEINNESTLIVRQTGKDDIELKYRKDAPDNEVRDILMTYTDKAYFKVHLKIGKGIAPTNNIAATCTDPEKGCSVGCYGNHCLDVYDLAGNSKGQYRGTHIIYGFYAPAAGFTCRTEPKVENSMMTIIDQNFAPAKDLSEEEDNEDEEGGLANHSDSAVWNIDVSFQGRALSKEWHWTNVKIAGTQEPLKTEYEGNYPFPYRHDSGGMTLVDTSFYDNADTGLILAYYADAYNYSSGLALIQKGYCIDANWLEQLITNDGDTHINCADKEVTPTWDGISTTLNAEQEAAYIKHESFTIEDTGRWINDGGSSTLTISFSPIN